MFPVVPLSYCAILVGSTITDFVKGDPFYHGGSGSAASSSEGADDTGQDHPLLPVNLHTIQSGVQIRRSELAGLRCDQLDRTPEGMTVRFGATKTDPEGRRIRPVALLEAWLEAAGIADGAVFRDVVRGQASAGPISDRTVARVVQRAARAGASLFRLKDVSRHRSTDVLAAYVREAGLFTDHAGKGFL